MGQKGCRYLFRALHGDWLSPHLFFKYAEISCDKTKCGGACPLLSLKALKRYCFLKNVFHWHPKKSIKNLDIVDEEFLIKIQYPHTKVIVQPIGMKAEDRHIRHPLNRMIVLFEPYPRIQTGSLLSV
ncbi:hypothetical protein [Desulfonatronospira sp.]|uniref:hypothetical protein n=1 Tax=Desulfonatronospira sp. TaxID=1962951 RepID=UPI0025C23496|nr:hypothetical protein [Desulfonatronospira sp.]